jgi:hypothetical protein
VRWIALGTLLLLLSGCYYYPYGSYPYGYYPSGYSYGPYPYGYGGYGSGGYAYAPNAPYAGAAPEYGGGEAPSYGQPTPLNPNNCGTPDAPRPCYR